VIAITRRGGLRRVAGEPKFKILEARFWTIQETTGLLLQDETESAVGCRLFGDQAAAASWPGIRPKIYLYFIRTV
jgi:hypothetical protein